MQIAKVTHKEIIRPCVCTAKEQPNRGCKYGMPALIPYRNDEPGRYPLYWSVQCPKCGRGGIQEFPTVNAALRNWNKMQDSLWSGPEGFNIPIFYPAGQEDTYKPLYQRYHELLKEIGFRYLLEELTAEEKAPLMAETRLEEKINLMEAVLQEKRRREEELRREWDGVDVMAGGYDDEMT